MDKVRRYRWWILGTAIGCLLLPTYIVFAQPGLAQSNPPDFSWAKDLPPLLFLTVCAVVIIALLVYLFTRVFPKQEPKITVATPEGQPDKKISTNEFIGIMFQQFIDVVRDSSEQNRQTTLQFGDLVKQIMTDVNAHQNMVREALSSQKDEIIQGRGNQMSALIEISDNFTNAMRQMQGSLATRSEQMERVNGGIGYLQLGQTKMQENLNTLLSETRKLTESIAAILTRIERIDATMSTVNDAELAVKDELKELTTLVHSLDDRLNKISIVAGSVPPAITPLILPELPAVTEKEKPDVK